jgi:hypothetical protein
MLTIKIGHVTLSIASDMRLRGLQGLLHYLCSPLDDCCNTRRLLMRQKVGDPDRPTAPRIVGTDLHGGMVIAGPL